jgi:hypothetical protein
MFHKSEEFQHPSHSSSLDDSLPSYSHTSRGDPTDEDETTTSFHLQADYANLKNLYVELQKGLDELNGIHGQRLTRYIA